MISSIFFYDNGGVVCQGMQGESINTPACTEPWFMCVLRDKLQRGVINDHTLCILPGVLYYQLKEMRKIFPDLPPTQARGGDSVSPYLGRLFFYINGLLGSCQPNNQQIPMESRPWYMTYLLEKRQQGLINPNTMVVIPYCFRGRAGQVLGTF